MDHPQTIARVFGVLFLITFLTSIPAYFFYVPVLDDSRYIVGSGADTRVSFGALLEMILIIANIGTAVVLYPIVRRQNEILALGYVTARIVECVFIAVGILSLLTVVTLRQEAAAGADGGSLVALGESLVALHEWTRQLGPGFVVGVGNGLILGYQMYRSTLVPRGLAVLGLIGGPLIIVTGVGVLLGVLGAVTRRQDVSAFLSVLYRAVERHGAPGTLVTDSGSVFLSNRARAVYAKLGVSKEEIEKGRPWQSYSETTFGIQQRMADWHFARAESWAELAEAHDRFVRDYNAQEHFAHQRREDGRRSPSEVLSWVSGIRFHPEDLERAFFSERHTRVLDALGYATLMRWRLYAEEGLAGEEAELWLLEKTLTVEHAGEPL